MHSSASQQKRPLSKYLPIALGVKAAEGAASWLTKALNVRTGPAI